MAKPKETNPIHLRFDHEKGIGARKDLLNSEIGILTIAQTIKNYKTLRAEELRKKELIYSKIKSVKLDLTKLKRTLPKVVIPKILKKELLREERMDSEDMGKQDKITRYGTIEDQLRQIQAKLRELEKH